MVMHNDRFAPNNQVSSNLGSQSPFTRAGNLGAVSEVPDTSEADNKKIEGMIPTPAAQPSTDDGFKKMLGILGYSEEQIKEVEAKEKAKQEERAKEHLATTTDHKSIFASMETKEASKNAKVAEGAKFTHTFAPANPEDNKALQDKAEDASVNNGEAPAEPTYTDDEVLPILDSILTRGYASESFFVRGAEVTLRSQFYWEDNLALRLTESQIGYAPLKDVVSSVYSRYVLASNLERFGGNYFPPITKGDPKDLEKSLTDRAEFLNGLPTLLIAVLWNHRVEFYNKLGFIEKNFDRLVKAF